MRSEQDRRRFMCAAAALAVSASAFAAEPRRPTNDFSRRKLGDLIGRRVGAWDGADDANVVPDRIDDSIDRGQTVMRIYAAEALSPVMLAASYHGPHSPELKVHRPETCYTVAGFACEPPRPTRVLLGPGLATPAVTFVARREARVETVLYWTRVGERFPQTLTQQRLDFLTQAVRGLRADGLLLRVSAVGEDVALARRTLDAFAAALVAQAGPDGRELLLGRAQRVLQS